jgi:hypothetical protein
MSNVSRMIHADATARYRGYDRQVQDTTSKRRKVGESNRLADQSTTSVRSYTPLTSLTSLTSLISLTSYRIYLSGATKFTKDTSARARTSLPSTSKVSQSSLVAPFPRLMSLPRLESYTSHWRPRLVMQLQCMPRTSSPLSKRQCGNRTLSTTRACAQEAPSERHGGCKETSVSQPSRSISSISIAWYAAQHD